MTHLSLSFRYKRMGGHVWVRVFGGPDSEHRAKLGDLTFTVDEWVIFMQAIDRSNITEQDLDVALVEETA